jgi:hypothetical protein
MEKEMLDLFIQIEDDYAELYYKLGKISRLREAEEAFKYLTEESFLHSRSIMGSKTKFSKPLFNNALIMEIAGKIRDALFLSISKETDFNKAIDELANTEENLGKIYKSIAAYLVNLGNYYHNLASTVEQIGGDEYQHRDKLLELKK